MPWQAQADGTADVHCGDRCVDNAKTRMFHDSSMIVSRSIKVLKCALF